MSVKKWIAENAKAIPGQSEAFYRLLHYRIAAYHHMLEHSCTYEWANTDSYLAKIERAEGRIESMLRSHPNVIRVERNRDPRIPSMKAWLKDGQYNYCEERCWAFHE